VTGHTAPATYVVTGANTGVGRATAEGLAAGGAHVILACRSAERTAGVLRAIADAPIGSARFVPIDLADLTSVQAASEEILSIAPRVDALVNNAGVGGARGRTADGFELAFGVNYLAHYLLTRLLMPVTERVVHVTSGSHRLAKPPQLSRLQSRTRSLTGIREYATSKLCTMLFHHELARRTRTTSLAADPGDVASEGFRHVPWPIRPLLTCRMKPPREGALTSLHCATSPALQRQSGRSFVDCREDTPSALSQDEALAVELWEQSAAWVGIDP